MKKVLLLIIGLILINYSVKAQRRSRNHYADYSKSCYRDFARALRNRQFAFEMCSNVSERCYEFVKYDRDFNTARNFCHNVSSSCYQDHVDYLRVKNYDAIDSCRSVSNTCYEKSRRAFGIKKAAKVCKDGY